MEAVKCKKCGCLEHVKNGKVRGHQRYRCAECGCNFTATKPRGMPIAVKSLATLLYAMGGMSFGGIGRLLGVSDVSIMKWVRKTAEALPEPEIPGDVEIVMLDEMHHFLKRNTMN